MHAQGSTATGSRISREARLSSDSRATLSEAVTHAALLTNAHVRSRCYSLLSK